MNRQLTKGEGQMLASIFKMQPAHGLGDAEHKNITQAFRRKGPCSRWGPVACWPLSVRSCPVTRCLGYQACPFPGHWRNNRILCWGFTQSKVHGPSGRWWYDSSPCLPGQTVGSGELDLLLAQPASWELGRGSQGSLLSQGAMATGGQCCPGDVPASAGGCEASARETIKPLSSPPLPEMSHSGGKCQQLPRSNVPAKRRGSGDSEQAPLSHSDSCSRASAAPCIWPATQGNWVRPVA